MTTTIVGGKAVVEPKWLSSIEEHHFAPGDDIMQWTERHIRTVQRVVSHGGVLFVYTDEEPSDATVDEMEELLKEGPWAWAGRVGPSGVMVIGVSQLRPHAPGAVKEMVELTVAALGFGTLDGVDADVFADPYSVFKVGVVNE